MVAVHGFAWWLKLTLVPAHLPHWCHGAQSSCSCRGSTNPAGRPFPLPKPILQGALPADADPAELLGGSGPGIIVGGSSGLAAGLEPTMTIATADAFAALNTMFKVRVLSVLD